MRLSFLSPLAVIAAMAIPCRAQNAADIPPPKPPLVAPVPDRADWTITIRSADAKASASGGKPAVQMTDVHTTATGNIRRIEANFSNGTKTTQFFVGTLNFWQDRSGAIALTDTRTADIATSPEDPGPTIPEGFPGTRWLQLSHYDKVIVVQTRPCYHYAYGELEAWIDCATKLPVAYKGGKVGYTFKFNDPPAEALTLPPEFQKVLQNHQESIRRQRLLEQPQSAGQ